MAEPAIRFYGITDVGRKRDHNEDAFYFSESDHYGILADGMGGRHFGEVAAGMTVQVVREKFETFFPRSVRQLRTVDQLRCTDMVVTLLDDWIRDANFAVWSKGQREERFREMGTTLAMIYTLPNTAIISHIGDSRVYHVSKGDMSQVTNDHSFVNSQVATGAMTKEEAQSSAQKNIITRAIGTSRHVKPEFKVCHAVPGDRFMICSDGLTDMVSDEVIQDILVGEADAQNVLASLVHEANTNGGRDNITILLVDYQG